MSEFGSGLPPTRFSENVHAIVARCRRVDRRAARPPGLSMREWLAIFAASAVLVLVVGLAFDDISVARARALPGLVSDVFSFISQTGKSQWELWPSGLLVLFLLGCRWNAVPALVRCFFAELGALSLFIFASVGGVGLLVNIVKQPIGRGRPTTFDEFHAFVLQPFRFGYDFQSFPSGHAATAGAVIAIGFLVFTRWRIALLWFGLLVGVSRIAVGAHYPSDVVAGWILGFGFTMWLAAVFARYGWAFRRGPTGTLKLRIAAMRRAARSPARSVLVAAGLVDAITGRPRYVPALIEPPRAPDGRPPARHDSTGPLGPFDGA